MSDPILWFLSVDAVALLLAGGCAVLMPMPAAGFLTTGLCGLGLLLCLPPLLLRASPAALAIPLGPPGLSLLLAIDPLSLFFLVIVLVAATALAAFQVTGGTKETVRVSACCAGGAMLSLMAADGVTLAIGLGITGAAIMQPARIFLVPPLLLGAVCLLTPTGYAPRFDTIRAAPLDPDYAAAATLATLAAVAALVWPQAHAQCRTRDTLTAGVLVPAGCYLLLRLAGDLCAAAPQVWWGIVVLLAGAGGAVTQGWRSVASPGIDTAIAALLRQQVGIAIAGVGLALIGRAADLAPATNFALQATCLAALGAGLAGTMTTLAAHSIVTGAGSTRLDRLGGLIHTMPHTSAALAAGLLGLSALPPGFGFAALWLALQSILAAPRTGGLPAQLPLAVAAAALVFSAALATAAALRIAGIALLGRPRTPRGAGAVEVGQPARIILLTLSVAAMLIGVLPGPALWLLADPAIRTVTGLPSAGPAEILLSFYLALPVVALLALATGAARLASRRPGRGAKLAGPWNDGMPQPIGLPFGEPAAQSAGTGFLPALPDIRLARLPRLRLLPPASSSVGLWLILGGFGALLLALAIAA